MENLARFTFDDSKIVVVRNVNSISKSRDSSGKPEIKILYTSNKEETVNYLLEIARDYDFSRFQKVVFG